MSEKEFVTLTIETLKEFLEDVPDDYLVMVEDAPGSSIPVMDFDMDSSFKEFVIKPGDLND